MRDGLNVDPANPHGRPDVQTVLLDGFDHIRLVPRPGNASVVAYCIEAQSVGLELVYVFVPDAIGWDQYLDGGERVLDEYPRPAVVFLGNEPDGGYIPGANNSKRARAERAPSSWIMEKAEWANFHFGMTPMLRDRRIAVGAAAMCSGHPHWADYGGLEFDVVGVHPYAKEAPAALDLLRQYPGPRAVSEWHRPANQIEAFVRMLREEVVFSTWFCDSEGMVAGFGRRNLDGQLNAEGLELQRIYTSEERPVADKFLVGPGIRALMAEHGEEPATDETYYPVLKEGRPTPPGEHQWSETRSNKGVKYEYIFATNECHRFPPDSA